MYEIKGPKLSRLFKSLTDANLTALGFLKPELWTRAVVELEKNKHVAESSPYIGARTSLFMKRKDVIFTASLFQYHDSCRINRSSPRQRGPIWMALQQQKKQQQSLLTDLEKQMLLTAPQKQGAVMEMSDA